MAVFVVYKSNLVQFQWPSIQSHRLYTKNGHLLVILPRTNTSSKQHIQKSNAKHFCVYEISSRCSQPGVALLVEICFAVAYLQTPIQTDANYVTKIISVLHCFVRVNMNSPRELVSFRMRTLYEQDVFTNSFERIIGIFFQTN